MCWLRGGGGGEEGGEGRRGGGGGRKRERVYRGQGADGGQQNWFVQLSLTCVCMCTSVNDTVPLVRDPRCHQLCVICCTHTLCISCVSTCLDCPVMQ